MELDDIVYLSILIFTIVFGRFFRQIKDIKKKKWISTVVGFLIVLSVSGIHILHPIICTIINAVLILNTSKRSCHIYSLAFSFLYLIFFRSVIYFGLNYPPLHTNLIQMMLTLKMVGLAFEEHDSYVAFESDKKADYTTPSFSEIFHFAFCHIGVLTGPHYSYKTFSDYYKNDFYKYVDCNRIAIKKLSLVPIYAVLFLIMNHYYPVKYVESYEFYSETTFWYRLWYISPVFVSFRMRIYVGLILSEAACIIAGLGAYPAVSNPKPGRGPTENFEIIEQMKKDDKLKSESSFNFETVHNIDTWYTETDPSVRSSIRYWNMCIQYWLVYVVYRRFPIKALRTTATFVVSALWHGVYAGYYLCLCSVPVYLYVEDIWTELLRKDTTGMKKIILNIIFWIVRTQAFSYMAMAFSLLSMKSGLRYYGSVYYIYHITSLIALLLGLAVQKIAYRKTDYSR